MKKILLVIGFFISLAGYSQSNYTTVNMRYIHTALAPGTLHAPAGATPALGTGAWLRSGGLFVDTVGGGRGLQYYLNGNWIRVYDTTDNIEVDSLVYASWYHLYKVTDSLLAAGWGKNFANADLTLTGNRLHNLSENTLTFDSATTLDHYGYSSPLYRWRGYDGASLRNLLSSTASEFNVYHEDASGNNTELSVSPTSMVTTHSMTDGSMFFNNTRETLYFDLLWQGVNNVAANPKSFTLQSNIARADGTTFFTTLENQIDNKVYNRIYLDSINGIQIGTKKLAANTYKGIKIDHDHQVYIDSILSNTDTTNWKPLVINTTGSGGTLGHIKQSTYWYGGGGGTPTLQQVVDAGNGLNNQSILMGGVGGSGYIQWDNDNNSSLVNQFNQGDMDIAFNNSDNGDGIKFDFSAMTALRSITFQDAAYTLAGINISNSWADGIKQTFNPDGTNSGLNVGSHTADPSAPANGDIFYDSDDHLLRARINGAWVSLGAGADNITIGTTTITSGTNTRILYNNSGVVGEYTVTGSGTTVPLSTSPDFTTGITIGSVAVPTISSTNTLTNKRWVARVTSETSSATPTINTDNSDIHKITALATNVTSMTTNLSGTPNDGDVLEIQFTGTATRTIAWGASFVDSSVALPLTTDGTTTLTVILQWYSTSSYGNDKWHCVNYY